MKRLAYLVMALALVLGFTQCKKEQTPANNETEGVFITLDVNGGNNSRVIVDPSTNPGTNSDGSQYATVAYEDGDIIYVGYNNAYVGELTFNGTTKKFEGTVSIAAPVGEQPLHFYFLGGKDIQPDPESLSDNKLSVVISDQTSKYPVISYAPSNQDYTGTDSYTAKLQNKCSIMKVNVTTRSTAAISIMDMSNKVTLDFSKVAETGTGLSGSSTDNGFTYEKDGDGVITMRGKDANNGTWAIVLPQVALVEAGPMGSAYNEGNVGIRPTIHAIESNKYYYNGIDMTVDKWNGNLATLTNDDEESYTTATDGMTVYNTLPANVNVKVSIAAGATVTLQNATINGTDDFDYDWAGITCPGNATLELEGTNNVKGFSLFYPGVFIESGKTLTIKGNGTLIASSNGLGAGIGGGYIDDCGNIVIESGTINATGGLWSAGIGGGSDLTCGHITITGGTVTAQGGIGGAGIGAGFAYIDEASCGNITISNGNVTAYGGQFAAGIGSGCAFRNSDPESACGDITISGGTVVATGGAGGYSDDLDLDNPVIGKKISGGTGIGTGSSGTIENKNYKGNSTCGTITIGSGVTSVTATKGSGVGIVPGAVNSIGLNNSDYNSGTCGTITIAPGANVTQN